MIFAFAEDGMITVHDDQAGARRQWEPIDVESAAVVFYAEDGSWLKPEFVAGGYSLHACADVPPDVDPIAVALVEATGVKPNPYFDSVDAVRRHVQ